MAVLAIVTTALGLLCAHGTASAGQPLRRDVLALYDRAVESEPSQSAIHHFMEMPLEHLGYRVIYRALGDGLPQPADLGRFRAVIVWLRLTPGPPPGLSTWLAALPASGTRVLLVASAATLPAPDGRAHDLLPGLTDLGYMVESTHRARVSEKNASMLSSEGALTPPLPPFPAVVAATDETGVGLQIHLSAEVGTGQQRVTAVLAATGPFGGYVAADYAVIEDTTTRRSRWVIDPFEFLAAALGHRDPTPIPDVTTVSGRRAYFSHIDGDGWGNPTGILPYAERGAIAGEAVQRELIEGYPDLPVTLGIVAGDLDPRMGGTAETRKVARNVLALRHVEAGVHTYTHPYDWNFFQDYSRAAETARATALETAAGRAFPARLAKTGTASTKAVPPPRLYAQLPYDRDMEVAGAIRAVQALLPAGKQVQLYQWSGSTRPDETMLRLTRKAGIANLNGGDPRLDRQYASLTYLAPLSRVVGAERQIYAAGSNEFIYWGSPPSVSGFLLHDEMLSRTDTPRRLKPFNLYYHAYSAEQPASMAIVRRLLDRARREPLAPITAAHYAATVAGFFSTEIERHGENELRWTIRDRGRLETVRFDHASGQDIDMAQSRGVLGARRHGRSLFVALDPSDAAPVVALAAVPAPSSPRLVESRWRLRGLRSAPCRMQVTATGFGTGDMMWAGVAPGSYDVSAHGPTGTWAGTATAEADGRLSFSIPLDAIDPIDLVIQCRAG